MTRARDVADTQDNLGGAVPPYVAGKNRIINGAMDFWQRGTTASPGSGSGYYAADRWFSTPTAAAYTLAQETSVVPTGFQYALKATAVSGTGIWFVQYIESANCQDLAGKTVTLSAYCATSASQNVDFRIYSNATYGATSASSGWSLISVATVSTTSTMPAKPQSGQFSIPSDAKSLYVIVRSSGDIATNATMTFTGVQLEAGPVATPFSRHAGTLQGELAACQRYYSRVNGTNVGGSTWINGHISGSAPFYAIACYQYPVEMRIAPTVTQSGTVRVSSASTLNDFTSFAGGAAVKSLRTLYTPTGVTNGYACHIDFLSTAFIEMSAEL
jgi:hypothetical protein